MFGQEKQRVTTMTRASSGCEQVDRDNKPTVKTMKF